MGTCIEAAATAAPRFRWLSRGALHLSDLAARRCLERGDREPAELDLLINAGLYKDHNLAEPALAAMIQEDTGANPGHPPRLDRHGTFSFDVIDGGCGALTAARLVDAFVGPGTAQLGLVVAADADPSRRGSPGFHFAPAGGAMLLAHRPGDEGFAGFVSRTFPEDAGLFEAAVRWAPHGGLGGRGRHVLELREEPAYAARCVDHAVAVAGDFLTGAGLRAADVDLLIASQHPAGFAPAVARGLGLDPARVPEVPAALAGAHTAGPIAALEAAMARARFDRAAHVLFVTAGAGIAIEVALYRGRAAVTPADRRRAGRPRATRPS